MFFLYCFKDVASCSDHWFPNAVAAAAALYVYSIYYYNIVIVHPVQTVWRYANCIRHYVTAATNGAADRFPNVDTRVTNVRGRRRPLCLLGNRRDRTSERNVTCMSKSKRSRDAHGRRRVRSMVAVSPATANRFGWWHRVRVLEKRH